MKSNGFRKRKVQQIGGGGGARAAVDQTESLSDVDDREIAGYFNTKEEIHLKTIIWERLNQQFAQQMAQAKKLKKESDDAKKAKSRGTSNKNSKDVGSQMQSTMVNYDALKQLDDELNDDLGSRVGVLGCSGSLQPRKNRDEEEEEDDDDVHEEGHQTYDDDEQQHEDTLRCNTGNNYESYDDDDDDTFGDTNYDEQQLYDEYGGEYYEADYENS